MASKERFGKFMNSISPKMIADVYRRQGLPVPAELQSPPRRKARHTGTAAERKRRTLLALEVLGMTELPPGVEAKLTPGTPNGWEREYLDRVEYWNRLGKIEAYAFEPIRLRVGVGSCFYTPDIVARDVDGGGILITEIKGHRRTAAIVRVKAAALLYPKWRFRIAKKTPMGWEYEELSKGQKP